ncbi:MAG TPA: Co2+/Mg2+ efflux protein ApaG [Acidiferrobacteraceae bacterium]|nr:Co2+/Mg2+ efflux protein ApaG [Acidiferrobacteraceae bacterium]
METDRYRINVQVKTAYVESQSEPDSNRYVFAYTITITNAGSVSAQLITRHWVITDANNRVQEVRGEGVVGEQPKLEPGMSFEYTSGAVLETPVGSMQGSYQLRAEDGTEFDASISAFTLATPRTLH